MSSYTPNLGLYKPDSGETGWGSKINDNFDIIDDSIIPYVVTSVQGNGDIEPSGIVGVKRGASKAFTIAPNPNSSIDDVLVDDVSVGAVSTYTFNNVQDNHTIKALFISNILTITATVQGTGTISPSGAVSVNRGENKTFTITPGTNYRISDVLVDNVSVGAVGTYTFTNVQDDHSITAVFVENPVITASVQGTGTISPSGSVHVTYGGSQAFTITPGTNNRISDVLVDGASVGIKTSHTFSNVRENHTIVAVFVANPIITASVSGGNGSISPSGSVYVSYNGSQTFTMSPNSKYRIQKVLVDGADQGNIATYTFNNVTSNHTIVAYFEEIPQQYYTFTIHKDIASTSPKTCVTYDSGSVHNAAEAYTLVHDNWVCPSVVQNGTVNYFLYKPDLSYKATDETGAVSSGVASVLTGEDGDVCASFKPVWWKITENTTTALTFQISDGAFDGAISAHKFNGTIRKWLHIGMFDSTVQMCTSVYSTSAKPKDRVTNDNFRSSTEARGDTYSIMTYLTWSLWDILCVFTSGSINTQATIGRDFVGNGPNGTIAVSTSAMLTANGYTSSTKTSGTKSLMYLFVANPWGNALDFVCGLKGKGGQIGVATDQYHARGVTVDADIPPNWTKFSTSDVSSSFLKDVQGVTEYPFLLKTSGGSSSTYFCDYADLYASSSYCANVGGYFNSGGNAGAFMYNIGNPSSHTDAGKGARLQILDIQTA